jgi:rhodanese-related sulfurtransferase
MLNIKTLLILAIVAIITIACATRRCKGSPTSTMPTFSNVDVDGFQTFIATPDVQLLDVRTPDEYADGHIAGAVLVDVNESDFEEKAVAVLDASRPVAVYCRSGRRSSRAASLLTARGYKVTNLEGGVMAWQDAGKALVK